MRKLINKHEEKIRYLIAGVWNTAFGYFLFVFLFFLLSPKIHYLMIFVLSNIVAITNAYISYKFFVFKTKGNYLKEYMKFYLVYGTTMLANLILLPLLVESFKIHPIAAISFLTVLNTAASYLGHRYFSFGLKGKL